MGFEYVRQGGRFPQKHSLGVENGACQLNEDHSFPAYLRWTGGIQARGCSTRRGSMFGAGSQKTDRLGPQLAVGRYYDIVGHTCPRWRPCSSRVTSQLPNAVGGRSALCAVQGLSHNISPPTHPLRAGVKFAFGPRMRVLGPLAVHCCLPLEYKGLECGSFFRCELHLGACKLP